jgi:hypothetical protein
LIDAPLPSGPALELEGSQRRFYERLVEQDADGTLGGMYIGALMALSAQDNPDHLSQAASSIAELMEKLPRVNFGDTARGTMGEQANVLSDIWNGFYERFGPELDQSVGEPMRPQHLRVIRAVATFVEWNERNTLTRSGRARRILQELTVSGYLAPAAQTRASEKLWEGLESFFNNVKHHRGKATAHSVAEALERLETLLLALWMPETTADSVEIDELTGRNRAD